MSQQQNEAEAKAKAEAEAKAQSQPKAKKSPTDPVKVKCAKVTVAQGEPMPTELIYKHAGVKYSIPTAADKEMKGTMPREAADLLLLRAKRYWSLKADLVILEAKFS